jgi:hypothetical protein
MRERRTGLRGILLSSLLTVVSFACGGGSDDDSDPLADDTERLTTLVVGQLGADAGFDAVIYAFERGYTTGQVIEAIERAWLRPDGQVRGKDGSQGLAPSGQPLGLVRLQDSSRKPGRPAALISYESPPRSPAGAAPAQEPEPIPISVDSLRAVAAQQAQRLNSDGFGADREVVAGGYAVALVLQYSLLGYSPQQIVEALILGAIEDVNVTKTHFQTHTEERHCIFLRDESGRVVVPAQPRRSADRCQAVIARIAEEETERASSGTATKDTAAKTPTPAAPTAPPAAAARPTATPAVGQLGGVYRGTVTLDQCTQTCATRCSVTAPISVDLRPDGSVRGSAAGSVNFNGNECRNPFTVGPPITGRWDPSSTAPVTLELEMGVANNPPAILSLRIQGGKATISLVRDTRPSEQARYTQFDAELTKQ